MLLPMRCVAVLIATLLLAAPLHAADDNGFGVFWQDFQAAVKKNDSASVQRLTKFPFLYQNKPRAAGEFGVVYRGLFTPKARACLAKARPLREQRLYQAFCGPVIFVFARDAAGWRFTEFGADGEQ